MRLTRHTIRHWSRLATIAVGALLPLLLNQSCRAEGAFPYVAYVTQNESYVRSGPGGDFYPTGLRQKDELKYAAEHLTSIEINGSFYSLQRPSSYAACVQAAVCTTYRSSQPSLS